MADNLNHVNPGDQILATQYNNLVDAVGGPADPNSGVPFTKTANGPIFNGGDKYIPQEQVDQQTPLFSLMYSTDTLLSAVPGEANPVYSNPPEFFSGIWCFLGDEINAQWVKHEVVLPNSWKFVVDFTADSFRLIHYRNKRFPTGWVAISNVNKATFLCVFQVRGGGVQAISSGGTFSIIGDFSKCPNYDPEDPTNEPSQWMEEDDLETIKQELKRYQHNITEEEYLVLLEDFRIYTPSEDILDYMDDQNPPPFFVPPLAENVGVQYVEPQPDTNESGQRHEVDGQYDTFLSSIQYVPSKYYATAPIYGSWTYGLYNFSTLSSTSDDLSTINDNNDLSSYDVLIKHKAPHPNPRQLEGMDDQCSAVLEYMPLSSLIGSSNHTGDANSETHNLSSIYLSSDGKYELYNFHLSGTQGDLQQYQLEDCEFVVRDSTGDGKVINYVPYSWLSAKGGDADEIPDTRRSIELVTDQGNQYYQLYDFDNNDVIELSNQAQYEFVVRYHNQVAGRDEIKYGSLSALEFNDISGDANVIPSTQNTIITVEDQQGNKWHQLYRVGAEDTPILVNCEFQSGSDNNFILNEGNHWANPEKQFVIYNKNTKRLEYVDIGLHIPRPGWGDLDDNVLPEISSVIIPEVSSIISAELSAELSALDDKYWIKGEDETENYGSSIGDSNQTQVIDLDNKRLVCQNSSDYWRTGSLHASYDLKAQSVEASYQFKIGNTTLNETQLQQLLALLNTP